MRFLYWGVNKINSNAFIIAINLILVMLLLIIENYWNESHVEYL